VLPLGCHIFTRQFHHAFQQELHTALDTGPNDLLAWWKIGPVGKAQIAALASYQADA